MTTSTIKVALVDDHDLFREGIRSIMLRMEHIELVAEASNGIELLAAMKDTPIDVILMDLEMPDMDGIEATENVLAQYPDSKILVLTMHNEDRMITYLMESGVHGYLVKNTQKIELEQAIHEVHTKGHYFNHQVSQALLTGLKKKNRNRPSFTPGRNLSSREHEILQLICQEKSTQEIAEILFISPRTVEGHRQTLLIKLEVKNTIGMVLKAVKEELVSLV
ncbi:MULTISPECIES: response regulator transcription factor [Reichenbachiella]|uniref:Two component transcriptional regulator, LuxR family n=1 Tax=Reichenbachiella agariperforans TaxID=156994 RepID=A0A1M6SN43_REIAG|nr:MULTISPECIES: response regulator transcription factor [Reichenbachiella]MBU2916197.1 response regulator transcription factor [Reichenbachiella agariperforans]RJE75050.1 hypothetical protein BGP76_18225 [Reichenbachiella sp. MSK19-1]SHK46008.1 two component transcriptional regulator, LuxR family [Reichenbachiella agariperforans]